MKKQNYTRQEVINVIDEILQHGNAVMDAVSNENTDYDGEALLEMAEERDEIIHEKTGEERL